MGRHDIEPTLDSASLREFTKAVLDDLRALKVMLDQDCFEKGVRRIGAEQEMFLVDKACRPAPNAPQILSRLNGHADFTTELATFNLELNLAPKTLTGKVFSTIEAELNEKLELVRNTAREDETDILLTGILPTLHESDLTLDHMTPEPRYRAINEATNRLRKGPSRFRVEGADEIHLEHGSVMMEACNTSYQVHFQVSPQEFVPVYNISQLIAAPVLAAAANSPLLFGRRLWEETRIALFQHAIDTRAATPIARESSPRVRFGEEWLSGSVLEAFQDEVARFPVLVAIAGVEDPFEALEDGRVPDLKALQMYNSTVYSWNRPCYGIHDGLPHLRIECRMLPAGPTVIDEVANSAFWVGLMSEGMHAYGNPVERMDFADAKANFLAAARYGLRAGLTWFDRKTYAAPDLIRQELLPMARAGLEREGVDSDDIDRFLGIIETRTATGQTGSRWLLDSFAGMKPRGTVSECMAALATATLERQNSGAPVHEWPAARLQEGGRWKMAYTRVDHYMTTELFTVRQDELVDLVALLMDKKQLRHVLVEDEGNRLVGIVSYRSLIRLLAQIGLEKFTNVPVSDIMEKHPTTISPETSSLDALEVMRKERVSALPVLKDGKLVGLVSERSFMEVAHALLTEEWADTH
ncbi:MAG: glutamate-cysteine ligase family protein [Gemmatimonadota bacterium]|nr:glutamate-cysteine ligase family protein [Gemmatimonadota bacterium]